MYMSVIRVCLRTELHLLKLFCVFLCKVTSMFAFDVLVNTLNYNLAMVKTA